MNKSDRSCLKYEKKFKVGILSMQRIYNYGSFLQAYGLKKILEDAGCSVQFVDYTPKECLIPDKNEKLFSRKLLKSLEVFKYNAPFAEKINFIKYKKNYAKKNFPLLGIDEKMNYSPDVDLLVIGSDEVFNCVQSNSNVGFTPELFGVGQNAKKIISYAASFGNTTLDKLEQFNVKKQVAKWLQNIDALSVRDANSGKIIEELTEKTPVYNLDPVLMYDYMGKCKKIPSDVPYDNYMILYGYSGRFTNEECTIIRKYADKMKYKILCIGGVQNCCDKFIDCNPFEVIAFFKKSKAVVTDTFHGTILSIITHRQFVTFIRKNSYGNAEKLTDLLERLQLENRNINNIAEIDKLLSENIDYSETDRIIASERLKTHDYLKSFID